MARPTTRIGELRSFGGGPAPPSAQPAAGPAVRILGGRPRVVGGWTEYLVEKRTVGGREKLPATEDPLEIADEVLAELPRHASGRPYLAAAVANLGEGARALADHASQPAWWETNDQIVLVDAGALRRLADRITAAGYASLEHVKQSLEYAEALAAGHGGDAATRSDLAVELLEAREALRRALEKRVGVLGLDARGAQKKPAVSRRVLDESRPYLAAAEAAAAAAAAYVERVAASLKND